LAFDPQKLFNNLTDTVNHSFSESTARIYSVVGLVGFQPIACFLVFARSDTKVGFTLW
jgi:hypothetical protein